MDLNPEETVTKVAIALVVALLIVGVVVWSRVQPASGGDWAPDHAQAPEATFEGSLVTVHGFRNFTYRSAEDFDPHFEERTFDLDDLNSVWYIVTPFGGGQGAAHTFLSFGFGDSTFVSVSVEARRQSEEPYSLLGGMLKRFELIYVIGDERDLIGLRAQHRANQVYVYPIRTDPATIRAVFTSILERANQLQTTPEFYNTITNNCTTSILRHVNEVTDDPIRRGPAILFPARSDRLAYDRGLIDTELPFEEARDSFNVTARAIAAGDSEDFSTLIRVRGEP